MDPALAQAIVERLARAKAGDPDALAELQQKHDTGIDPLVLRFEPSATGNEQPASRSAAARKAWETRRAAGWVHPRSRGA